MENRHNLHYTGNTVTPPKPSKAERKRWMRPQHEIEFEAALPEVKHRICAVKKCVWCGYATDQYFITCPMCRNCQYCGYVDEVDPFRCYLCGNYLPEHLQSEITPLLAT